MGLFDGIQNWLWQVAFKKAASKGIKAAVAVVLAPTVIGFLSAHGVHVQVDNAAVEASAVAGLLGGYEYVRNFLKGKGFSFLP